MRKTRANSGLDALFRLPETRKMQGSNPEHLRDSPMHQWFGGGLLRVMGCRTIGIPNGMPRSIVGRRGIRSVRPRGLRFSRYRNSFRKVQVRQDCSNRASGLSSDSQSESCPQLPHLSSRSRHEKRCRRLLLAFSEHRESKPAAGRRITPWHRVMAAGAALRKR